MFNLDRKLFINLTLLILVYFISVFIFGMGLSMKIKNGQMSPCPLEPDQTTACRMNIFEHMTRWQQIFLGIPAKTNLLALALILIAIAMIFFEKTFSKFEESIKFAARLFNYNKTRLVKAFNPLLLAFSDGILNPKIF
ncbi:MAG: hypothetical protein M1505_02100 [Patescibacteria group bacterium]|nr:hypothetical protein [Patescibacteria group bacterium]